MVWRSLDIFSVVPRKELTSGAAAAAAGAGRAAAGASAAGGAAAALAAPPADPGAVDLAQIDVVLLGELANQGSDVPRLGLGGGRDRRCARCPGRGCCGYRSLGLWFGRRAAGCHC